MINIKKKLKRYKDLYILKLIKNMIWLFYKHKSTIAQMKPVFIVGCGHSGTSILLTLLGSHSKLFSIPYESRIFLDDSLSKLDIAFTAQGWQKACLDHHKVRWVEKSPIHLFKIRTIFEFFPQAKIIIMLRDGRDVACSIRAKMGNFERAVGIWVEAIKESKKYQTDANIKFVKLEHMLDHPERTLRGIFGFLDEKYENEVLDYHQSPKFYYSQVIEKPEGCKDGVEHLKLRNWQINQPLFNSVSRWENDLKNEEKNYFKDVAQTYLQELGYVEDNFW